MEKNDYNLLHLGMRSCINHMLPTVKSCTEPPDEEVESTFGGHCRFGG